MDEAQRRHLPRHEPTGIYSEVKRQAKVLPSGVGTWEVEKIDTRNGETLAIGGQLNPGYGKPTTGCGRSTAKDSNPCVQNGQPDAGPDRDVRLPWVGSVMGLGPSRDGQQLNALGICR